MKFSTFNINPELVNALRELNYFDLTPIQEKSIPLLLKNKSLICKSETGSGKTHAYLVPLISNLDTSFKGVTSIILVPTTELALQVGKFLSQIEKVYPFFKSIVFSSIREKEETLSKLKNLNLPGIIVATPGRANDIFFNTKKSFNFSIKSMVFDEADMLFEDSYIEEVYNLYASLKPKQIMIFTATMKEHKIAQIKKQFKISDIVETESVNTSKNVEHQLIDIRHLSIKDALLEYLKITKPYFALVFLSSKKDIEKLYEELNDLGIKCSLLTGGLESRARKQILKQLENNEIHLLLASDVASRGIDFKDVSHVISLDIPKDIDYYFHRAGRTGRYDKKGISALFITEKLLPKINKISMKIDFKKYILKENSLKLIKDRVVKHRRNEELHKEIELELRKSKSKIKPCYKKKRKVAIIKAKKRHKKKIIRQNIIDRKKKGTM